MEKTKENIKFLLKELKDHSDFVKSVEKYFKKEKDISDKQFLTLLSIYESRTK